MEADKIKREFFAPATVTEICTNLISKYLPLSRDDLELWDTDPEQYGTVLLSFNKLVQLPSQWSEKETLCFFRI